jgi:two-component system, OmpR family, sensor histidine kinase CpxA
MKIRLPLYAQLLAWFFLNLLLLGAVAITFARLELGLTFDSLLAGRAGAQIDYLARTVWSELSYPPDADWDEVLERLRSNSSIRLLLYRLDGVQVAGAKTSLPPEVLERLAKLVRPGGPPGFDRPRPGLGRDPAPPPHPPRNGGRDGPPKFMLRAGNPVRYWVIVAVPPMALGHRLPGPSALVIESESLTGGGVIFDFTVGWFLAGALVLSGLWWIPFVYRITRTVSAMTRASERIAEGFFDVQLNVGWRDELADLARTINRLAVRLEGFVGGQRRFLGDIAHELCTPLARMEFGLGILEQRAAEGQREYLQDVRDEVQVMSSLVNELLSFSKAELRGKEIPLTPVEVASVVACAVDRERTDGAIIQVEVPSGLKATAHNELLTRAIGNLLRNAIRYAGTCGPIVVTASEQGSEVILKICDQGPGVPPTSLTSLGEPFYRPEAARTREGGGFGLGLAIVKSCILACGGVVEIRNRDPRGLEVELRLAKA